MTGPTISADAVDALALPRLVHLRPNLIGLAFPLMKLLPARFMIRRAREEAVLAPGGLIVESTSGTFGLGLAMVGRLLGHPVTLVSDPALDEPLRRRLEDLGATVHIMRTPAASGGFQQARLERLQQLLAEHPGSFWPRQYSNAHNPASYAPCAEQLLAATGGVDCLVGTVGSGGSMCGLAACLRRAASQLTTIGVDTHGSVLFGLSDAGAGRLLRGLGNSVLPANLDHTAFDWVHWVDAAEAFRATRELHRRHALYMGPTSGAAYLVADWWARTHPDSLTAVVLPDEGHRYADTVYNDVWLQANRLTRRGVPVGPVEWDGPHDCDDPWGCCRWNRRRLASVARLAAAPPMVEA